MTIGLIEAITAAIGESDTDIGGLYKTRLTSALQTGTGFSDAYAWDGTTTVTTSNTSEAIPGGWIRLDADGQYFEIDSIVIDTSVEILNPLGLVIPGTVADPLATQSSKAVTSLPVETTLDWDESGIVSVDGIVYHYASTDPTTFQEITHIAGGVSRPGVFKIHRAESAVVDLNKSRNAIDLVRRAMLVDYAEDEYLDALGRNHGVKRTGYLTGDDATFREVIKALSYNPRGTIYGMELALDALVGSGNYAISEDLVSFPFIVFISLTGSASTTLLSNGKAFIKGVEPQPATADTTVDVSRTPIAVGSVHWKDENLVTDTRTAKPSALDLDEYDGDTGRKEWTFVSSGGGSEVNNVTLQPVTTDSGCIEFTTAVDNNDAFYRHFMRIRPESESLLEIVATIKAGTTIHATQANQAALAIFDMERAIGAGCIQIDANNFGVGLSDPVAGTLLVGSAVTLAKGTYHTIEIRKSGESIVELHVNGVLVETALHTAFPASSEHKVEFGILIDPPTNNPFFRVRQVALYAKTLTDYWSARGSAGQTDGANPERITDAIFNDFAASDEGKPINITGSAAINSKGGNNNGRFVVDSFVGTAAVELVGAAQEKADIDADLITVTVPSTGYQFQYPDDLGKKIVFSGSALGNNGEYVIDSLLSRATGNPDLADGLSPVPERTNICKVDAGTPFSTAEVDLDWNLKPVFVNEGDENSWSEIGNPKNLALYDVTYGNGVFVAAGQADGAGAYLLRSTDGGASWIEVANPKNFDLYGIAYGNGVFVAVGAVDGADAYLLRSTDDGASWSEIGNPKNKTLNDVAYGNGVFVAVGSLDGADAYILRSTDDGASWSEIGNPKNKTLNGVTYGNGVFVAAGVADGADAYLLRSTDDGASWSEIGNPKNKTLNDVAYGNGVFVAVGQSDGADAYLLRSTNDGASWSEVANPKNFALYGVIYGNGVFVAVGQADGTDAYLLRSTNDGASWSEVENPKNFALYDIAFDGNILVAAGTADGVDTYLLRAVEMNWEMSDAGSFVGPTLTLRQTLPIANGAYTRVLDVLFSDVLSAQVLLDSTIKNLLDAYYPFYIADPLGFVRAYLDAVTAAGVIPDFEIT